MSELIIGPMYSGKTSYLMRCVKRQRDGARKRCICINYDKDIRYGTTDAIVTHDGAIFPAVKCSSLDRVPLDKLEQADVIAIDEGQFFGNVDNFVIQWRKHGKIVIVAALSGTFEMKPFPSVSPLYSIFTKITQLTAICDHCGDEAPFSKRITSDTTLEIIGGKELYNALCYNCFMK